MYRTLPACIAAAMAFGSCAVDDDKSDSPVPGVTIERISTDAGRVAWYKGSTQTHELLAFDRIVNSTNAYTALYTMEPEGSNVTPVSGAMAQPFADGFIGQPEWHPDGDHIVFQVKEGGGTRFEQMSFGINNDLWLINKDGSDAELLHSSVTNGAVLHPHFNAAGDKLIWADREPTGVPLGIWIAAGAPGGESPWAGWRIAIADFNIGAAPGSKVSNIQYLFDAGAPSTRGFFETHGFYASDTRFTYSHTANGDAYVDDVYSCLLDGSDVLNITNSPTTWDEHGIYSPGETAIVFNSSRADSSWSFPGSTAATLALEVFMLEDSTITQLTAFNANPLDPYRYLTSDFEWDRTGTRLVVQVVAVDKNTLQTQTPELWIITLPEAK